VSAPFELVDSKPGALNLNGMMRYRAGSQEKSCEWTWLYAIAGSQARVVRLVVCMIGSPNAEWITAGIDWREEWQLPRWDLINLTGAVKLRLRGRCR